jgi:hypothetical protein
MAARMERFPGTVTVRGAFVETFVWQPWYPPESGVSLQPEGHEPPGGMFRLGT